MEIFISRIKELAASHKKENKKFFAKLSKMQQGTVDELFHNAHFDVFEKFSCLDCANCCKSISPLILHRDVDRIAKGLGIKPSVAVEKYLFEDTDGTYAFRDAPCPFLESDNKCSIYPYRPKACREYPHTDRKRMQQIFNITLKNMAVCPAVFEVVEQIKKEV